MTHASGDIGEAVRRLRQGGVVAFPTETVYGLGADALSPAAVAKVFTLKGRPSNNPLIVHVTGPEMAARVCAWDDRASRLARAFWPGPLSIVLPKRENVPGAVTGGGPGVAVRCPDHPVALALLFEFDSPLVGPSANLSGQVSPTTAAHVRQTWSEDEVFVLDGGPCRDGIESTVVVLEDLQDCGGRVLRLGMISPKDIADALGQDVVVSAGSGGGEAASRMHAGSVTPLPAPGMLERHYAPRTPARLLNAGEIERLVRSRDAAARTIVLATSPIDIHPPHALIEMPREPEDYAAVLYSALREADDAGATELLIERPELTGHVWDAIRDRLMRATARG
jgi:L-threonylcarbamoyladenylate synthase